MNFKLFIWFVLFPMGLAAQLSVTLQDCWLGAREQLPVLQNGQLLSKLDSLEQLVLKVAYLPQLNAKAQVSWQSDVPSMDMPIPNIVIDEPSKEQYKVYLEVNQLIWDGGRTKSLKTMRKIETQLSQAETDEVFYGFKQRVVSLYFALMLSQQQSEVTQELLSTLDNRIKEVEVAVKYGVVKEVGKFVLRAEKLQAEQDLSSQVFQRQGVAQMLSVLTGLKISGDTHLEKPLAVIPDEVNRSQLSVYQLQKQVAEQSKETLAKGRMPLINAFGQAGYGKPGLNMLNNEADTWLMIGAGLSWNIFDWNSTKRKRQQIAVQQDIVDNSREQFLYQIEIERQQHEADIQHYEAALARDKEIVSLRGKIADDYGSQLKQGTVTPSAYIDELFKEQAAIITMRIHDIKLNQAQVSLQILLEK